MKKYLPFLTFWLLDSVLLYLAYVVSSTSYVLGNAFLTPVLAAIVAGFAWTILVWNSMPLTKSLKIEKTDMAKNTIFYLMVNFISLWVIARFAAIFGFGVASYLWVLYLAVVANILQWGAWSMTDKAASKKK